MCYVLLDTLLWVMAIHYPYKEGKMGMELNQRLSFPHISNCCDPFWICNFVTICKTLLATDHFCGLKMAARVRWKGYCTHLPMPNATEEEKEKTPSFTEKTPICFTFSGSMRVRGFADEELSCLSLWTFLPSTLILQF